MVFLFFKQKTAYEMRISDWSSDVCSSYLQGGQFDGHGVLGRFIRRAAGGPAAVRGLTIRPSETPRTAARSLVAAPRHAGECNARSRADQVRSRRPPDRPFHEGHGPVPDVRLFQPNREIGSASCRERVCTYVEIRVVAVS